MARRPILENAVMDLLWDRGEWMIPMEVRAGLERVVAPTTVATVLTRLHEKGRVERRKRGKAFEYRATQRREEYVASVMQQALDRSHDRPLALLEFIDRLPDDDRSRLQKILKP